MTEQEANGPYQAPALSAYDLRLRSLDEPRELHLCTVCDAHAFWSVWLHSPEWSANGGSTMILCTPCALASVRIAAADHDPEGTP